MMNANAIALLSLLVATVPAVIGQDLKGRSDDNASLVQQDRIAVLKQQEEEAIDLLKDEAAMNKRPKTTYYAIKFLEFLRSEKSVSVLCDRLVYKQEVIRYRDVVGDREFYPASAALVAIGKPSIEGLLLKIGSSETSVLYQEVAFGVIYEVMGKDRYMEAIERFEQDALQYKKFSDSSKHSQYKSYDQAKITRFKLHIKQATSKS